MTRPEYIVSGNLNVTLILDGQTHSVAASHPNHKLVLDAIREERWDDLPNLVTIRQAINTYSAGRVVVDENGNTTYDGQQVHNTLAERIRLFFENGLDFSPLVKFLENLMENPSRRSVEELYPFLENAGMAITEDGCFVGYKGVRDDFLDVHSGTFDNSPGSVISMPRREVDDDARNSCSYGFHIGSQSYAAGWGPKMVLVKVNPKDCVSVPYANAQKLRVCEYEVLREVDKSALIASPLFEADPLSQPDEVPDVFDDWLDEEEEETCENCGELVEDCYCDNGPYGEFPY